METAYTGPVFQVSSRVMWRLPLCAYSVCVRWWWRGGQVWRVRCRLSRMQRTRAAPCTQQELSRVSLPPTPIHPLCPPRPPLHAQELDDELQEHFRSYLTARGINEDLGEYLRFLLFDKEQVQYRAGQGMHARTCMAGHACVDMHGLALCLLLHGSLGRIHAPPLSMGREQ